MKNVAGAFSVHQKQLLKSIDIALSDETDYSDDDLMDMHDKVTDFHLSNFSKSGEPNSQVMEWEALIDVFYNRFGV